MRGFWIAVTAGLILAAGQLQASAEELLIGAGAAPVENILKPCKDGFEKATGIKLSIVASGPKVAMNDLQGGAVDAAAAGLSLQDWLAMMKKEGSEVKNPGSLVATPIGKDRIVVITHKENAIKSLSKEQLKGIFSGETASWKEVGGADAPILVVWGKLTPGTNSMFAASIMDGKPVTKEVLDATTAEDVRQNVTSNASAVGIGPAAIVDNTVNSVAIPEIGREINLVTKGQPSAKVRKLIDYIRGEGQKYIKK